jgi:hypothetical protein
MSKDFEIFKTYDDFVGIFLAQRGFDGVLVYRDNGSWTFYANGSVEYDSYHQAVYRNHRAGILTREQLSRLGIPLPDFEQYRGLPSMRWEDNFPVSVAAAQVPARVRSRLEAGPRSACLVLLEDRYETALGDGKYLYPNAAFWDKSAAEQYVDEIKRSESDSAKREWYEYTLREIPLRMDPERGVVIAGLGPGPYEHFSIVDVVRLLEKSP